MKKILNSALLLLILASCQNTKKDSSSNSKEGYSNRIIEKHWSYNGETGPEHWKEIETYSNCDGKYQSPINIVNYNLDETLSDLSIFYSDSTHIHDVINNGHTIQYNFDLGDYITIHGKKFSLKQFHFHEPAEHLIDGIRYPMELHLVHVSNAGEYAVLAIMAKEGQSSKPFDFLESYLPINVGETKNVDLAFDMNLNLPKQKTFFTYTGSLTTPPCTESVEWYIFKEPITVSLEQVEALKKLMPMNNYRNEQPINGRTIKV
ncbi:carbonic anhydrase family protein [Litoribaculum gwangyangense]|uniref:Carbonic anhydrase family protein n=1 Tax=Litoribaculum gwangyangense TaxID=1130722 RepID=A0ABP9CKF6_9FLAO